MVFFSVFRLVIDVTHCFNILFFAQIGQAALCLANSVFLLLTVRLRFYLFLLARKCTHFRNVGGFEWICYYITVALSYRIHRGDLSLLPLQ